MKHPPSVLRDMPPPIQARHMLWHASVLLAHSNRWHRGPSADKPGFYARRDDGVECWSTDAAAVAWDIRGAIWRAGFELHLVRRQTLETPEPALVALAETWMARGIWRFWKPGPDWRSFGAGGASKYQLAPAGDGGRLPITADDWRPAGALLTMFNDRCARHIDILRAFQEGLDAADRAIADIFNDPPPERSQEERAA